MALGNFDIAKFKPQRSETAASLLTVAPQKDEKKTERLELRIRSDILILFKEICASKNTDASKALRQYIDEVVDAGALIGRAAFSNLSVQNVRTNENGPLQKQAQGQAACGELNLRNKEERERWLNEFRNWGVWLDVPEASKKFYRYDLRNGCSIIVEVGAAYSDWTNGTVKEYEQTTYAIIDEKHQKYNSSGDSFTMVLQWLTKYSKEL